MLVACIAMCALAEDAPSQIAPDAFANFADEQMNSAIVRDQFPGAAIVLVEDGTIAFARGYGVADLQTKRPIDPLNTGFRIGSISKLFAVVATLQLAERGKLSLSDAIQPHLPDIDLGEAGHGVTIHNLLTHTDGFEVGWSIGGAARDERDAVSLGAFLQTHRPRRILPPGQMYVYSDVGMALAGRIVENVSGESFAQYTTEDIFSPAGMDHSTFDQPLPQQIAQNMATGYRRFHGRFTAMPTEHVFAVSSAGMTTTPGDMARFMIACLNDGQIGGQIDGQRLLSPESMSLMRTRQFSHHPDLPGTAYGFYEHVQNGQTAIMHSGVMPGYHATIMLFPRQREGIFVATNGYGDDTFEPFVNAFFDRFFPKSETSPASISPTISVPAPADLAGRYRYVQYPHNDIGKLSILIGFVEERRVRVAADGTLIVDQGVKGPFRCIAPLLYSRGEEKLAFRQDDAGRTIGMVYDTWAFAKIHSYQAPQRRSR